jgi:hypothetical protein
MLGIGQIYDLHMQVSYNPGHPVHRYIENRAIAAGYQFNKNYIISINRYNRYDTSIQFVKGYIFLNQADFYRALEKTIKNNSFMKFITLIIRSDVLKCFETDQQHITPPFPGTVKNNILRHISDYQTKIDNYGKTNDLFALVGWIFDLYQDLRTNMSMRGIIGPLDHPEPKNTGQNINPPTYQENNTMSLFYFLGLLEWFHLLVIKMIHCDLTAIKRDKNNGGMIMGEVSNIEIEHMILYSNLEIKNYFASEYCSHATLYLFDSMNLFVFDPDPVSDVPETLDPGIKYRMLARAIGLNYEPFNLERSIQAITDDQYCIFHCLWFIQRLCDLDIKINKTNINKFMNYVNKINLNTHTSDVHFFIKDLAIRAQVFHASPHQDNDGKNEIN